MTKEKIKIKKVEEFIITDQDGKEHIWYDIQIENAPHNIMGFMSTNLLILKNHMGVDLKEGDELEVEEMGEYHRYYYKDDDYNMPKIKTYSP